MRLWILSDIHTEVFKYREIISNWCINPPEHDALVVAGDISSGVNKSAKITRTWTDKPIYQVAGNHEYYGRYINNEISDINNFNTNNHFYGENTIHTNQQFNVRFIMATLWSDMSIMGNTRESIEYCWSSLNDYYYIMDVNGKYFSPYSSIDKFVKSVSFITDALKTPFDGKTVIVTHHAPHRNSIAEKYKNDVLTAGFVSDLSNIIKTYQPNLWVHGHVHDSFDYCVGQTRVVCNPMGYLNENKSFINLFTVDV